MAERLRVGAHSTIAGGCVIRGEVVVGENCSLNAGASTIGRVTIGDVVRIAAYAVLVGENHVFDDLDVPIAWQGLTSEGRRHRGRRVDRRARHRGRRRDRGRPQRDRGRSGGHPGRAAVVGRRGVPARVLRDRRDTRSTTGGTDRDRRAPRARWPASTRWWPSSGPTCWPRARSSSTASAPTSTARVPVGARGR